MRVVRASSLPHLIPHATGHYVVTAILSIRSQLDYFLLSKLGAMSLHLSSRTTAIGVLVMVRRSMRYVSPLLTSVSARLGSTGFLFLFPRSALPICGFLSVCCIKTWDDEAAYYGSR